MQSLSLLSSLKAKFCALVKLGLGGWEDLRTLLISALSSSASCWLSLVQAASMAVMYSKLGGCLGVTEKLSPLARTDLWAGVKGLLDRLMTHLGLGSSLEELWGGLLGGVEGWLSSQEMVLFSWEAWGALCLGECLQPCLTELVGLLDWPAWGELVAWGMPLPSLGGRRAVAWEALLPSSAGRWAIARGELGGKPDAWLLTGVELLAWEGLLTSLEGSRAPAWLLVGGVLLAS